VRTFDELVADLRAAEGAGFDVTAATAGRAVNEAVRRLASISKWVETEVELGPTVIDQELYEVDANIVDLSELIVGEAPYLRVGQRQFFRLKAGTLRLSSDANGAFAPRFTSAGLKQFGLYPTPDAAGDTILGFASITPEDLTGTEVPPFPDDLERAVLDGAKVVLYQDVDENPEEAAIYDDRFRLAAEDLRRRRNSRLGSGPVQILKKGVHW
jgi:hypothetical protein